jgi:hypothetical protein
MEPPKISFGIFGNHVLQYSCSEMLDFDPREFLGGVSTIYNLLQIDDMPTVYQYGNIIGVPSTSSRF